MCWQNISIHYEWWTRAIDGAFTQDDLQQPCHGGQNLARWIADGQIWLSVCTAHFGFKISKHSPFLCRPAYPFIFFLSPSLPRCPSGESMGVFFFSRALPLFTWLFVLGCHIISLSVDVASLRAHNEEVLVARGLVSLHRGYHRMLGHAMVRVWT